MGETSPIQCTTCSAKSEGSKTFYRVASISGSIMGDECIESLYFCETCNCYSIDVYWDYFSGEESSSMQGPLTKEKGDALVAIIKRCKQPDNKKCRCAAHMEYFDSGLD